MLLREELLKQTSLSEKELQEWERLKLIRPDGVTKAKVRVYSQETLELLQHVRNLNHLGYEAEHILKIIKKVGIPRRSDKKGKQASLNHYLTVGDLAEKVGISPRAVKHWEDKGIIEPDMRSDGGFRLYSEAFVYLCQLIKDLQLFGYSLERIKAISDLFRKFLALSSDLNSAAPKEAALSLEAMTVQIEQLQNQMELLKSGIERWEDLLKKKHKEISSLKAQNQKRNLSQETRTDA